MSLSIAFLGNDPWSVPPLEAIAGDPDLDVRLVVTNPPRPAGRGGAPRPTAVASAARRLEVRLLEADGVTSGPGLEALHEVSPSVVVVAAYGEILDREVLELPPFGALNVHFSLLPRWRGAAPVQHALLAGDDRTGVTIMRMDEGLDTGPILNQLEEDVRPEDDAGALGARLAHLGGMLVVGVLRRLTVETIPGRPQDERAVTWAPRLGSEDRHLDWSEDPDALVRRVRALSPTPGALTSFRSEPVKVFAAGVAHDALAEPGPPGTIELADARGVLVSTAGGGIRLIEVAPAGRRRMGAAEWARGARFQPGERLG
jgi:methionyl-tRNA formyltransferase